MPSSVNILEGAYKGKAAGWERGTDGKWRRHGHLAESPPYIYHSDHPDLDGKKYPQRYLSDKTPEVIYFPDDMNFHRRRRLHRCNPA